MKIFQLIFLNSDFDFHVTIFQLNETASYLVALQQMAILYFFFGLIFIIFKITFLIKKIKLLMFLKHVV